MGGLTMARFMQLQILSQQEIEAIKDASLVILRDTGVMVHHEQMLRLLGEAGAKVSAERKIARLPEQLVLDSVARAGKQYVLYGRARNRTARFGYGDLVLMSSPGQYAWIDLQTGRRRAATMQDAHDAIRLGDALDNITIVGSMAQPETVSEKYRDVVLTGALVQGTGKPTRCWVRNGVVRGNETVGGLIGESRGEVYGSRFDGQVAGHEDIGGVVGRNNWGLISLSLIF